MKRIGLYSLLLFFSFTGFSQTQLTRGGFSNGTVLNGSSASYQLKSSVNGIGFRAQQMLVPVSTTDSLALVELYNATGGPSWADATNWLSGTVDTWVGITLDTAGRVMEINLSNNNLSDSIPESFWNMVNLKNIALSGNFLNGSISPSLSNLTMLENFVVNFQQSGGFTGSFPNALSGISSLREVNLRDNYFSGTIDSAFWELPLLDYVYVSGGDSLVLNIPASSAKTNLRWIDILQTDFSAGIPSYFLQQTNLQHLTLEICNIQGVFPVVALDSLSHLNIGSNAVTSIDNITVANMPLLGTLSVFENQLNTLPDLSAFTMLTQVEIWNNYLEFDQIENLKNTLGATLAYTPQKELLIAYDTTVLYQSSVTLAVTVGGSLNNYQWYKDGTMLPGETTSNLTIASMTETDIGGYFIEISSDTVTDLTLQSNIFNVQMSTSAQNYYWIGDGGDWHDQAHWSLTSGGTSTALIPDANDDVRFDSLSFTLPGQVVTILDDTTSVGVEVRSMDWTGVKNSPTFQVKTTVSDYIYNRVFGSLIFDQNMQLDFRGAEFYFAPETNYVLDTKGLYLGDNCWLAINFGWGPMPGANVTCDVLNDINPAGIYLNKGRLNLNGYNVVEKDSYVWVKGDSTTFDATGSYLDISNLYLNASTIGATLIADSSTFKVSTNLRTNGVSFNKVILSDSANVQLYSNTYNELEVAPGSNVVFASELTQTIGTFIANGTSSSPINISASKIDTAAVLNVPTGEVNVNYVTFKDNEATGGALFNAYNSIDSGNVIGWNFRSNQVLFTQDSLALVALYNATDGANWTNNTNWLVGTPDTWFGVTVTNSRVTSINFENNLLVGALPLQMGDLTALDSINFDANKLTSVPPEMANLNLLRYFNIGRNELVTLPDLSALSVINDFNISYNFLDFDDIIPNSLLPGLFVGPQNIINTGLDTIMVDGGSITIDLTGTVPGTGNVYQWQKDGVDVPGSTNEIITFANFSAADAGTYVLSVTNPGDNGLGVNILSYNYNLNMLGTMYWIGDGGDWKDIGHWSYTSGAVDPVIGLPGPFDDVRFDSLSFTLPGQVVTILDDTTTVGVEMRSMNWTGVTNTPTFQVKTTVSDYIYNRVFGSMIFDQNMLLDFRGAEFYFAPETNYVLDTKGLYLGDNCWLAINYGWGAMPGANVICDVLSDINPAGIYLNNGRLNLNGYNVVEKDSYVWVKGDSTTFDATGSYLDISNLYLNASTIGATLITDSSTFKVSTYLRTNGVSFNKVILSDSANVQLYSNTYNVLEVAPGSNVVFASELTQTIGTFIANGTSTMPISISASKLDTAAVLNVPTGEVNVNYVSFKDNEATGGALFYAFNSLDSGNVTGWNFISNQVLFTPDSLALVALYNATDGANWTNNTNWLAGTPDTWFGISIADNRVVDIDLGDNNLTGSIPSELGGLSSLQGLNLVTNQLIDSIPPELGNLGNLNSLWLFDNQLTGPIPSTLGNLNNLILLWLHSNQLSGPIPPEIGNLTNLERLELPSNQLSGAIPPELGNLINLQDLTLNFNQLTGQIPKELGNLTNLQFLLLNNNQLAGSVPQELSNLAIIENIRLEVNNLTDLPDLSSLSTVTNFNVTDNFFTFEDLEPNVAISGLIYNTMKSNKQSVDTLLNTGDNFVMTANTGGTNNQYSWIVNGSSSAVSTDTLTLTNLSFDQEGQYFAEITNSIVTGLTLRSDTFNIRVSSLQRDSVALHTMYTSLDGANWNSANNWTAGTLTSWEGVVISNNRVTEWIMPTNNIAGDLPTDITDIENLEIINLQGNTLTKIPNVTSLSNLTSINVSQNNLEFGSLESNVNVVGINYANQDSIGNGGIVISEADMDYQFNFVTSGSVNNYQWFKEGVAITDSTGTTVTIPTIRRAEMGNYYVEVTNDSVPGLTLTSKTYNLLAQTSISGVITLDGTNPMTNGEVTLLKVTTTGGYDTISVNNVTNDGSYLHNNILLDDYITIIQPDTLTHKDYLPTYYSNTIFWEEADTIYLDSMMIDFNMILQGGPAETQTGDGKIVGILEEEVPDGGRIEAKKRVSGAGVSVRRRFKQGKTEEDEYELIDYVYSNENGEFGFYNLEVDEYLINIQYPGYPMDTTSNINITVGTDRESDVEIAALVDKGKISVRIIEITGTERAKYYESVEIYPNPVAEKVYFRGLPQGITYKALVIDVNGKIVIDTSTIKEGIDVNNLTNGLYILNIYKEGSPEVVVSSRLMVQE